MPTKKWNIPDLKKKAIKHEDLKSKSTLSFLKNVLGVRKDMSSRSKDSINRGLDLFNKIFGTDYIFDWKRKGQADMYNVDDVKEKSGQKLLI